MNNEGRAEVGLDMIKDLPKEALSEYEENFEEEFVDGEGERSSSFNNRFFTRPIKGWVKAFYEWVSTAIFGLTFFVVAFVLVFRLATVIGDSMQPTLYENQRILLSPFLNVSHGDIAIIDHDEINLVKRVIAVEGDRIRIDSEEGKVYLNGKALPESYVKGHTYSKAFTDEEQVVPEGHIFVLGDNREDSGDSRELGIGFIDKRYVIGKVVLRYAPLKEFKLFF